MRRIVAFNRVTVDGYFAGADGNLDWVVPDDEIDKAGAGSISQTDAILFGRKTYDQFESFWPHALEESKKGGSASDPHVKGRQSPALHEMAVFINEATKVVFSRSKKQVTWNNSHLHRDFDPKKVEAMKREPGKAIMVFGSGQIASLLTQHDLIDDYIFVVAPVLLGSGRSLINDVSKLTKLDLTEVKQHRSGNVTLRYTRKG
jgi:dihydrofolate reductase